MREALSILVRTAHLVWSTSPGYTLFLVVTMVVQGITPIAQLWVTKLIIDELVTGIGAQSADLPLLMWYVAIQFALMALGGGVQPLGQAAQTALGQMLRLRMTVAVMEVATRLEYAVLEDSTFHDKLQRVQRDSSFRPLNLLMQLSFGLSGAVGLISVVVVLLQVHVLAPVVVLVVGLPYFWVQSMTARMAFDTSVEMSPEARRMSYLSSLVTMLRAAKEIRVFGLRDYLLDRYRRVALHVRNRYVRNGWVQGIGSSLAVLVATGGFIGAYVYLIRQVAAGLLTIGDLTVYTGAFLQGQGQLSSVAMGFGSIKENGLFLRDVFEFFDRAEELTRRAAATPPAQPVSGGGPLQSPAIAFTDVSFRYPRGERDALRGVSLQIASGRVVAIVGENGAGKTTLIKLLCGLYQPTQGRVALGEKRIQEIDLEVRRATVSVLFQDFVSYFLTLRENIGFGDLRALRDDRKLDAAAARAGLTDMIANLPQGYETQIGKMFEGGHEFSGGEWQRMALARAYLRDAPILILDEPTASLDPKAERQVFEEVRERAAGRTIIIISHRFSTVRLAEHIYVMHEGEIVEQGSHEELVAAKGRYASFYAVQAAAYQ